MPSQPRAPSLRDSSFDTPADMPRPGSYEAGGSSASRKSRTSCWSARSSPVSSVATNRTAGRYRFRRPVPYPDMIFDTYVALPSEEGSATPDPSVAKLFSAEASAYATGGTPDDIVRDYDAQGVD